MLHSLRLRATLCFAIVVAVVMGALSYVLVQRVTRDAERDQGDMLQALARSTTTLLAEGLHERMREIELLAEALDPQRMGLEAASWQPVLDRMQRTRPQYSWIGVADPGGRVQAATGGLLVGADVRERPWFQEARNGPHAGDVHPAKLLAKLLPASQDGGPLRFIDFAAPLRDRAGGLIGVIGAHGSWDWAHDVIAMVRAESICERGVEIFILDRKGEVIYQPGGPSAAVKPLEPQALPGQPQARAWSDGAGFLTVAMAVPARSDVTRMGWTVVVRQPAALVRSNAAGARDAVLWAGLAAALAGMLLAWWLVGRFSRPLGHIADAARRIEAGELQAQVPEASTTELRDLSESLRSMTRTLVDREQAVARLNETLEQRVLERTDALARANEELEKLARRDALTGLFNRRAADDRLREEFMRHARTPNDLAVLLVDIDHFKRINDTHGHATGDAVLQEVALRLARGCRATDFVARFGGEEFLVLLPDTGRAGAWTLADKLRTAVSETAFPTVGTVTLSIGVAGCGSEPAGLDAVLRKADEALYCAKQAGRNRVVLHDDGPARAVA